MATSDGGAFERFMQRSRGPLPAASWGDPDDLGRLSIEAMVSQREDVRDLTSQGSVRLTGAGVVGHSAPLEDVGAVASSWQRCVTAVGASLEGVRTSFGQIPRDVVQRTRLTLTAAPAPGSIQLDLAPESNPLRETSQNGQMVAYDTPRPLADQASEALIALLDQAATTGPDADELGEAIRRLGPRVASHIRRLADVLEKAHFDLDVAWAEPNSPTRRAKLSAGTAGWLKDFVAGRALDGQEQEMSGTVRTVSDIAKWQIETADGLRSVDATSLEREVVEATHVNQTIRLLVLVRVTERPDGTSSHTFDALEVLDRG